MVLSPKQYGKVEVLANQAVDGTVAISVRAEQLRAVVIPQATAGITLTLPNPTDTAIVFGIDVINTGTEAFALNDTTVTAGKTTRYLWSGSSWSAPSSGSVVSPLVGGFMHFTTNGRTKAGDLANGILWVVGGDTISNGVTTYPVWAGMYPEYVSGADIVFPSDVNGMFIRNSGGNATTEGVFQSDLTSSAGLSISTGGSHTHTFNTHSGTRQAANDFTGVQAHHGSTNGTTSSSGSHTHSISGGVETRPDNRAYQLVTFVDTFNA